MPLKEWMNQGGGDSRIKVATLEQNISLLGAKGKVRRVSSILWAFTDRLLELSPSISPTHLCRSR